MHGPRADIPCVYLLSPGSSDKPGVYGSVRDPVQTVALPRYTPKGSVVVVRPAPACMWPTVAGAIETVGHAVVNAPIALWLDCVGRRQAVRLAGPARLLGANVIIWTADPLVSEVRDFLTDDTDWPRLVTLWLRRRGRILQPRHSDMISTLAASAATFRTLEELLASERSHRTRWSRDFRSAGLGPPSRWHAVLRCVGIAMAIQRESSIPIAEFAEAFGFSSASALSDRLQDVIGARPGFIRARLGAQWMLADATRRMSIM